MRKVLLYIHLAACLVAGVVIMLLCITGIMIAFKPQIVAFSESDAAYVGGAAAHAESIKLPAIVKNGEAFLPGGVRTIELENNSDKAILIAGGKNSSVAYVNPWDGSLRKPQSTGMREFMQTMTDLHRWLGLSGQYRPAGRFINGVGNALLLLLVVSGIYLWWPRKWSKKHLQAVAALNLGLKGRARHFNQHNVIGLWTAPLLLVITLTALPISFRAIDRLVSMAAGGETVSRDKSVRLLQPLSTEDFRSGAADRILAGLVRENPQWQKIVIKRAAMASNRQRQAMLEIALHEGGWLRKPPQTLILDGISGTVVKKDSYEEMSLARKLRFWERTLHNGTALGWIGQLAVTIGAMGGAALVYTGVLLALRRLKAPFSTI